MSLLSRLRAFLDTDLSSESAPDGPQRLAVAALLVHVARVDGLLRDAEEQELQAVLQARFDLSEELAAAVLEEAEALDQDTDGTTDLVDRILRSVAPEERQGLLALAYRVAVADGQLQEVEDDLVWRIGRLLGLGEGEIEAIRGQALVAD